VIGIRQADAWFLRSPVYDADSTGLGWTQTCVITGGASPGHASSRGPPDDRANHGKVRVVRGAVLADRMRVRIGTRTAGVAGYHLVSDAPGVVIRRG
jgi:hypothetical protein